MRIAGVGRLTRIGSLAIATAFLMGASPAPPTYQGVQRAVDASLKVLSDGGPAYQPAVVQWTTYFEGLENDLKACSAASTTQARSESFGKLRQKSAELAASNWPAARHVAEELNAWLSPRLTLAAWEDYLIYSIAALPPAKSPEQESGRKGWVSFVRDELDSAMSQFESAPTVIARAQARDRLEFLIDSLTERLHDKAWAPGVSLSQSLGSLYRQPNVVVRADLSTVAPLFNHDVAVTGEVDYKGQRSFVTAGARTGFGLENRDDGIGFINSQLMTSITPVSGFNEEMAARDARAARATQMYYFSATTRDDSELTIHTVLKPTGLVIWPSYKHNVNASIDAAPVQGGGGKRLVASLIGMNRQAIVEKVYEGAIGPIRQNVDQDAMELGTIKTNEAAAERNAALSKYLPGNGSVVVGDVVLQEAAFRSRSNYVEAAGRIQPATEAPHRGATAPMPADLNTVESGVVAVVNLPTVLTNVVPHIVHSRYGDVQNLMIIVKPVPPGTPPKEGIKIQTNVDYASYLKAVEEVSASGAAKATAIRIIVPKRLPEFAADAKGNLAILVHDLAVEFPAPKQKGAFQNLLGSEAKVYRLTSPLAEFAFDFEASPDAPTGGLHVKAKLVDFDAGEKAQILAINDDETKGKPLTAISKGLILQGFELALQAKPIDTSVPRFTNKVELREASKLDPTGWMKVVVTPNLNAPALEPAVAQPAPVANRPATIEGNGEAKVDASKPTLVGANGSGAR